MDVTDPIAMELERREVELSTSSALHGVGHVELVLRAPEAAVLSPATRKCSLGRRGVEQVDAAAELTGRARRARRCFARRGRAW